MEWLLTTQEDAHTYALEEIRVLEDLTVKRRFGSGETVLLVSSGDGLASALKENPPIFARHICPVHMRLKLSGTVADIEVFRNVAVDISGILDFGATFSVQSRFIGGATAPYKRFDINDAISGELLQRSYSLSVREPEQVISVAVAGDEAYIGVSRTSENLSAWAGGARRYKQEPEQISRAEFKLLEAMEVFGINTTPCKTAIDFGAAPGGWTRILLNRGLSVTAVDPAAMHESLTNVKHYAGTAQQFIKETRGKYDVIVNDMRMDSRESAALMCEAALLLKKDGIVIMTLKLAQRGQLKQTRAGLDILRTRYDIRGARQLFHNRSEVTVALTLSDNG